MTLRARLACTVTPLLLSALVTACGGKTTEGSGDGTGTGGLDSGISSGSDAGLTIVTTGPSGCIDVELTPAATVCSIDDDCTLVKTGDVCTGQCSCGNTPVNNAAATLIQSETSSIATVGCPCAFEGEPRCIAGQCIMCGFGGGSEPAGCNEDGGTITSEDGGQIIIGAPDADQNFDSSTTTIDASGPKDAAVACIEVDLSSYDQSCNDASDCTLIQTGTLCNGSCACGGSAINVDGEEQYEDAISGITFAACPCAASPPPACISGMCVECGFGPNQPPGCADAG